MSIDAEERRAQVVRRFHLVQLMAPFETPEAFAEFVLNCNAAERRKHVEAVAVEVDAGWAPREAAALLRALEWRLSAAEDELLDACVEADLR